MALILDGKVVQTEYAKKLRERIASFPRPPVLAIVQVGDVNESNEYIHFKKLFALSIGAEVWHDQLPESISENDIYYHVRALGQDRSIDGIIIQLPLPPHLNRDRLLSAVHSDKDVDGLSEKNRSLRNSSFTFRRDGAVIPATTRGILELLNYYKIPIEGKTVAVLGRSFLVGQPTAEILTQMGALVTVCHSQTTNTKEITQTRDIVVVAIGKPRFITRDYLHEGQIVIDVGINVVPGQTLEEELPRRHIIGDVDFEGVKDLVSAITPVPGGVGPMTILALFENLADAFERRHH